MIHRRKSAFEKWFSFTRHRRRFGADEHVQRLDAQGFEKLRESIIQSEGDDAKYAHGASVNLDEHLAKVRREFIGQSELLYQHAMLIVLIRREADVAANYERFKRMWMAERDFLTTHLDMRWLLSACDTFIDLDTDPLLRAVAMNGPLLANTVKLGETERFILGVNAETPDKQAALDELWTHRVGLFDGVSGFIPGTDDTLRNMRWRLEDVCKLHPLGVVVMEIFDRLQRDANENVYLRFKKRHTREKTRWWD
ncbi:hypothetical protein G7047_25090 [Diaphorobacter sp. HDW4A]|uniref:hypothetical protein n=1 Tax=Diaphorobacter sp. HDW4A TaxID=2714924 RepID=UPI00140806CA|nr:hypothetical protein [Diaphorobacter sp. HDW4A]QIL82851.1 hypothetical protein G7047_25090 [Diaphorobacter sp. HDW4A]